MLNRILLGMALMGACCAFATEGVSDMATKLFGKEETSKRVATGAVFVDGLYLKGPYSVTREGNAILINGRVVSRFKVESAVANEKAKKAATDTAATKTDPAASGEDVVSDQAGSTINGGDPVPTLPNTEKTSRTSKGASKFDTALAKRGGGLETTLAAKKRAKELAAKSATGTFNTSATSSDPMALFEEADYTYTPPSKPEAKAVPYVRPASQKSVKERLEAFTLAEKAKAEKGTSITTNPAAGDEEDVIATESFDDLSEQEIADYIKKFSTRRATLEKLLEADSLLLLASNTSATKVEKRPIMWRFVLSLGKLCETPSADKLQNQWGRTLPRAYLQKIYDNRVSNSTEMKTLVLRVTREDKEARERSKNRL